MVSSRGNFQGLGKSCREISNAVFLSDQTYSRHGDVTLIAHAVIDRVLCVYTICMDACQ